MKSIRYRRQLWQLVPIIVLTLLFVAYLKVGLLPGRLKVVAQRNLEAVLRNKVEFDRIVYLPFRGISIDNLKTATMKGEPLFRADRLVLRVPLLVFLIDNRIVVSRALLEKPVLTVWTQQSSEAKAHPTPLSNAANPQPQSTKPVRRFLEQGADGFLPDNVYLERLVVKNGLVIVKKSEADPRLVETISGLHLDMDFKDMPRVPVEGALTLGRNTSQLMFRGIWDMQNISHEAHVKGKTDAMPEWALDLIKGWGVRVEDLSTDLELRLVPNAAKQYDFEISTHGTRGTIRWQEKMVSGVVALDVKGTYDAQEKKAELLNGALGIRNADLTGLAWPVGELRGVSGHLLFDSNQVRFKDIEASWHGTRTFLTGNMMLGSPKLFHLEIRQRTDDLGFLKYLTRSKDATPLDLSGLRGHFSIDAELDGEAEDLEHLSKKIVIAVSDAEWKPRNTTDPLTDISGLIMINDERIQVTNASFVRDNDAFRVNGFINLEPGTPSEFSLTHPKFHGHSTMVYRKDRIEVTGLEIASGKCRTNLAGTLWLKGAKPFALEGKMSVDLDDLHKRFEADWKWLRSIKPSGSVTANVALSGEATDTRSIETSIKMHSSTLKVYDKIRLEDIDADLKYSDGRADLSYSKATLCDGEVRMSGHMDFKPAKPALELALNVQNMDLSLLTPNFPNLDEHFCGFMDLDMRVKGRPSEHNSLTGDGNFMVRDGKLFTTPLFKRLKNLVLVQIEGIDHLTFNEAQGDFTLADGWVHTSNSILESPLIHIRMRGKIGLDQTLALGVQSRFSSDVINESYELGGLTPHVIHYAETKITDYQVTGTLTKPVYAEQKAS